MNTGFLSQYFESVAAKKLSAVEVDAGKSNQHEFNGTVELKKVFGLDQPKNFKTTFIWIGEENGAISEEGSVTWYDSREKHPTRSEYRLYFSTNEILNLANPGDTLFLARRTNNTVFIIIARSGTTIERQLYWLFGLPTPETGSYELSQIASDKDVQLDFAATYILEEIGVEIEEPDTSKIDSLLAKFNNVFPVTSEFSRYARQTYPGNVDPVIDPDKTITEYMRWEEQLFRRLERHVVSERLSRGFSTSDGEDVDSFISFSLSVQNRRKSRAGYAFEDHVRYVLMKNGIRFSTKVETEHKSKPDFVFPGITEYNNPDFRSEWLTILGAKTSCKDRWRQVLSEARRISVKHLVTLEPAITENQTDEMRASNVQLVLPESIHKTYTADQQNWIMTVKKFIDLLKEREKASSGGTPV